MFLPPFFESKKFKIIYAVTMGLLLLMIVSLKIYDSFCEMPGCWNLKDAGTQYCWDHINSIYENSKKKSSGSSNGERIYNSFELFNQSQKYHYTPKRRNTPTPVTSILLTSDFTYFCAISLRFKKFASSLIPLFTVAIRLPP